jgi:hypothetical protein
MSALNDMVPASLSLERGNLVALVTESGRKLLGIAASDLPEVHDASRRPFQRSQLYGQLHHTLWQSRKGGLIRMSAVNISALVFPSFRKCRDGQLVTMGLFFLRPA